MLNAKHRSKMKCEVHDHYNVRAGHEGQIVVLGQEGIRLARPLCMAADLSYRLISGTLLHAQDLPKQFFHPLSAVRSPSTRIQS